MDDYTKLDKAQILYNHLWFSGLPVETINEYYKNHRYLEIIKNKNFNPRLIQFITDPQRTEDIAQSKYWEYVCSSLKNPKDIWENVVDSQISTISRSIVIAVAYHGRSISEELLEQFFNRLTGLNSQMDASTFHIEMKLLTGALLKRFLKGDNSVEYDLFNPSLGDYISSHYLGKINFSEEILRCLKTEEALNNFSHYRFSKLISNEKYNELIKLHFINLFGPSEAIINIRNYEMLVFDLAFQTQKAEFFHNYPLSDYHEGFFTQTEFEITPECFLFLLRNLQLESLDQSDPRLIHFVESWLNDNNNFGYQVNNLSTSFEVMSSILAMLEPEGGELIEQFKRRAIEHYSGQITDDLILYDRFERCLNVDDIDTNGVYETVQDYFYKFEINFDDTELEIIVDACDYDAIVEYNREILSESKDKSIENVFASDDFSYDLDEDDQIHDLFDREI